MAYSSSKSDSESVVNTAATQLTQLKSILINIPLGDAASSFAAETTWDIMGCTSFPKPNRQVCDDLARKLLDKFPTRVTRLENRLVRSCYDDRCHFSTPGYSATAIRALGGGNITVALEGGDGAWGKYLVSRYNRGGV